MSGKNDFAIGLFIGMFSIGAAAAFTYFVVNDNRAALDRRECVTAAYTNYDGVHERFVCIKRKGETVRIVERSL